MTDADGPLISEDPSVLLDECMTRAESELYAELTIARGDKPLTDEDVLEIVASIARAFADRFNQQELSSLDRALGFKRLFDFRLADPAVIREELHAAYYGQLRDWLAASVIEHLEQLVLVHPELLGPPAEVTARSRLSPLAAGASPSESADCDLSLS
jgi:hypothetical protein